MLDLSASYSPRVYVMLPFTPILPEKLWVHQGAHVVDCVFEPV